MKISTPYWAFCDTNLEVELEYLAKLGKGGNRLPHSASVGIGRVSPQFFSVVFGIVEHLLSKSFLSG